MIVDAHHHLWTADYAWLAAPDLAPIRRDYTMADLRPRMRSAGVSAGVLVEAGRCHLDETRQFLALADATPEIAAVVGWVSLTDPDLATTLALLREHRNGRWLAGVRDQVQGVDDPGYLGRADVRRALAAAGEAGLPVDLVVRRDQLDACARAAAATPGTTFVLDHLGKPAISPAGLAEWSAAVAPLAAQPNVVAKLSGLPGQAGPDWTVAGIAPFVDQALSLFGVDRLMVGSDWPVCELVTTYDGAWAALEACLSALSPGERATVHSGTAIRTYRLAIPADADSRAAGSTPV
jgi:L-fuconolactonase